MNQLEAEFPQEIQQEQTFIESVHSLGARALDRVQSGADWLRDRRHSFGAYAAAGALAASGAGLYEAMEPISISAATTATTSQLIHRNSKLKTQTVLNDIRHIVMPCDPAGGCSKFVRHSNMSDVYPKKAYINASAAGFTAPCNRIDSVFKFWDVSQDGTNWASCPGGGQTITNFPHSTSGEYQLSMNALGLKIEKSVKLDYSESTQSISGNRYKVTANYECASPSSTSTEARGIEKIVLERAYRKVRRHGRVIRQQYSKAAITPC